MTSRKMPAGWIVAGATASCPALMKTDMIVCACASSASNLRAVSAVMAGASVGGNRSRRAGPLPLGGRRERIGARRPFATKPEEGGRHGSAPLPREHGAHRGDELGFGHGDLRRTALEPSLGVADRRRQLGALDEVLDLHLAAG